MKKRKSRKRRRAKSRNKPVRALIWLMLIFFLLYNPVSARVMTVLAAVVHDHEIGVFYRIIAAESSFNALAVSRSKAYGLGQVQIPTARYIFPYYVPGMLFFPVTNLHISAIYYRYLLQKYRHNHSLALAAYNWGEGNVDRKLRTEGISPIREADYRELFRNIPETYYYIGSVLGR